MSPLTTTTLFLSFVTSTFLSHYCAMSFSSTARLSSMIVQSPHHSIFRNIYSTNHRITASLMQRYLSTRNSSEDLSTAIENGISRLNTLQLILSKCGAPGSHACQSPNDLQAVSQKVPNLHPHLHPICQSKSNPSHYICALRRTETTNGEPWPIVESTLNGPGYRLLSLNSEHLMRRIAAQTDFDNNNNNNNSDDDDDIVQLYNTELGTGVVSDTALDTKYDRGSVEQLGYGLTKYVLLRVGPFPDMYGEMARLHKDEQSSLIAAEMCNSKFPGFASTFYDYAKLLQTYSGRDEEARDAARMCLRLPLASIGVLDEDYSTVCQIASNISSAESTSQDEAMNGLQQLYNKLKESETDDTNEKSQMTPEDMAREEANQVLDSTVFDINRNWEQVRPQLRDIYEAGGMLGMADYVDPK